MWGRRIEQYRVEALLGVGDPVVVYRVRDLELGTFHTLKLLLGLTGGDRDRVIAEGQLQHRLVHQNLVGVTDVLMVEEWPAIVTDRVDGPWLEGWLAEGKISVDIALALFRGIVTGVGVAHVMGLVHRCLKPSCVLLGRGRSGAMLPKLTDFGLAHSGRVSGPTGYLAPELLRDPSEADARADLWALGCVLYELVCGVPAFRVMGSQEAITAGRYEDPKVALAPKAPSRVIDAIHDLLLPDREARIGSCTALWERLWDVPVPAELRDGVPLQAEVDSEAPTAVGRHLTTPTGHPTPVLPTPRLPAAVPPPPFPLGTQPALADWSPTPLTAEPRFPSTPPRMSARGWYAGAIVAAAVPAGLFALAIGALVMDQRHGGTWLELPRVVAGLMPNGTVSVEGDASEVWLEANGRRLPIDRPVPVGSYALRASWEDGVPREVGRVEVRPGGELRLRCGSDDGYRCGVIPD